jgi:very-short-patch-repair endonuclease
MRSAPTEAEALLWHHLRAHRFDGFKFKRQQPLGRYIVDFVCFSRGLVIEIDGSQHVDASGYDVVRNAWLQSRGFRVLRIWNDDMLARTAQALDAVWDALHTT